MVFFYYIFVLVIAAVTSVYSVTPSNHLLEQQVLLVLNKWREGSVQNNLFSLPSLDTVYIKPIQSYYDQKGINITFTIGDMKLRGLDNFTVEYLKITQTLDDFRLYVKVVVPAMTITSDSYSIKGYAFLFYPVRGLGKMSAVFRNVDASLSVNFANINDVSIKLEDFVLKYNADSVDINLENSSWPINRILSKDGVEIIKNCHEDIVHTVQNFTVPYANEYLAKISPTEFLKIVTNIGDNSYVLGKNSK